MIQKFMEKLSGKEKKLLYVSLGFVLLALFDRLFLGPVAARLNELDMEMEQQKRLMARDLRFLSHKKTILRENGEFSKYYANSYLTEEKIVANFLERIERLASEAGVTLIKVNPADFYEKLGYLEYFANLECDGTLESISKFIYLVDTSDDLLKVVKMNITPKRASAEEVKAAMTVKKILVDAILTEEQALALEQGMAKTQIGYETFESGSSQGDQDSGSGPVGSRTSGGSTGESGGLQKEEAEVAGAAGAVGDVGGVGDGVGASGTGDGSTGFGESGGRTAGSGGSGGLSGRGEESGGINQRGGQDLEQGGSSGGSGRIGSGQQLSERFRPNIKLKSNQESAKSQEVEPPKSSLFERLTGRAN